MSKKHDTHRLFEMSGWLGVLILVAGFGASCKARDVEQAAGSTQEKTASPTESVRQAIENINSQWKQAAVSGDAGALAKLYAEDAVLLAPGMPVARGRSDIEGQFAKMLGETPFTSLDLALDDVVVAESGDLAYAVGTFKSSGTTAGGESWQDDGKYLSVFRHLNGDWKLAVDTWNSDK
jgi:uncharacterized protein (TIGR02246 family)